MRVPVVLLAMPILLAFVDHVSLTIQSPPDAVAADRQHYTVEFENDVIRVLRIRYGAGERSVMHTHPANCGIFLADQTFRMTMADGSVQETPNSAGAVACGDAEAHLPQNIGAAPAELILIELKGRTTFRPQR